MTDRPYVPALGVSAFTGAYDALIARVFPEVAVKTRLLDEAGMTPGMHVLDLGCGTGTLAAMAARRGVSVVGVDADPKQLARAREKCRDLDARFVEGLTTEVEVDGTFDRVLTSLFLHHLDRPAKVATLRRARAWLAPGGSLHVADFTRPRSALMRLAAIPVRLLDGSGLAADILADGVPAAMREAGFSDIRETGVTTTLVGNLAWWSASA